MNPDSEFLTQREIAEITGCGRAASQRRWLDANGWPYVVNAAGRPIVGRILARMKLAGIQPTAAGFQEAQPNFAALG